MTKEHEPVQPELWQLAEENSIVQWVTKHGSTIAYAALGILVLLILLVRLGWIGGSHTLEEEVKAQKSYAAFIKDPTGTEGQEALQSLSAQLAKQKNLQPLYDDKLTEELLILGKPQEARPLLERSLDRTKTLLPTVFRDYAATSLTIAEGKYQDALNQAMLLHAEMIALAKDTSPTLPVLPYGESLFASNLLRIVFLQRELGLHNDEIKTWSEWKEYREGKQQDLPITIPASVFAAVEEVFNLGQVKLDDFIKSKKK